MVPSPGISATLPRLPLPARVDINPVHSGVDRCEVGAAAGVSPAKRSIPPAGPCIINKQGRRPVVITVVCAQAGYRGARPQIGSDPAQESPRVAIGRI